jgi:hypothetical protein
MNLTAEKGGLVMMNPLKAFVVLSAMFVFASCGSWKKSPVSGVHVQLNDGQVLVGELSTAQFTLKTELGTLAFDTVDAGELGPLEGGDMEQSDNLIRLWLRNGSEFVGGWDKPSVQMEIEVGGKKVPIDVPIAKLKRLRFRGSAVWSKKALYRVRTRAGDDFFVDAGESRIHFTGELGEFSPYLTEIALMERAEEDGNRWKVHLKNGNLVHVGIREGGLELKPSMGPEKVELSWNLVDGLEPTAMRPPAMARKEKAEQRAVKDDLLSPGLAAPSYYSNEAQQEVKKRTSRIRTQ